MGSIIKKKVKKYHYYYFVESARVNGKPRIVNQVYLGTADTIMQKMNDIEARKTPLYSMVLDFADVTLLYDVATRLGVIEIIDKHASKRKQGVSVGMYALIAAINRAVAPTSKRCIAEWYSATVLPKILPVSATALAPQNYWNDRTRNNETRYNPFFFKRHKPGGGDIHSV